MTQKAPKPGAFCIIWSQNISDSTAPGTLEVTVHDKIGNKTSIFVQGK